MGDDRFCFVHQSARSLADLLDEDDILPDLPDDDITVPLHALPPYQDEDDETVLPSAAHPSYPYGNPHATRPGGPSSTTPSVGSTSSLFRPISSAQSLATSLPVLAIRHLHAVTTFGDARDRTWSEMALDDLLPQRDDDDGRDGTQGQAGDAPQPTGQAAGDDPPDEEGEAVMEDV